MDYYTTYEQEKQLEADYNQQIQQKKKELEALEKQTGVIQKYTAYAHVHKPQRIFHIQDGIPYLEIQGTLYPCPEKSQHKYSLDPRFQKSITEFMAEAKTNYKVIFLPSGRYGPTIVYCADKNVIPATLIAPNGITLTVEDEDKYDVCVL